MIAEGIPHIVYDLSLPPHERKAKAKIFGSIKDTADYLGCSERKITYNARPGKKIITANGMQFAVRVYTGNETPIQRRIFI